MMNRSVNSTGKFSALPIAFCSIVAALGAAIMMTGGLIPVLTYCSPLLAGLCLIPVIREYGLKWAWLVWFVTAFLSLVLCADKEASLFYLFLGYYPIIKRILDQITPASLSLVLKIFFFSVAIGFMYSLILFVFHLDIDMEEFELWGHAAYILFFSLLVAVMLIYDTALKNLTILYEYKLRSKLRLHNSENASQRHSH